MTRLRLRDSVVALALASLAFLAGAAPWAEAPPAHPTPAAANAEPPVIAASPALDLLDLHPETVPAIHHEPPFPLEEGRIPTRSEAQSFDARYENFIAKGNGGLEKLRAEGHLQGQGTKEDPYVLERFYVDEDLTIQSTDRPIIVREGYVRGQLTVNYAGPQVYVHHVYATDLRINENVERRGPNTGGLWHDNAFGFVGQIRHFVGEFRHNEIGPRPQGVVPTFLGDAGLAEVPQGVVFNFDGFHAADVHHNRFHGQVDIKLHGHNHASCFTCPVHDHHDEAEFPSASDNGASPYGFRSRHSLRFVSLLFHDNEIQVQGGWALRYNDRNHAGDDRRAASEPNPYLEDPHVHIQDITFSDNRLEGGGFRLEIFNAVDDRHPWQNRGVLRLLRNTVSLNVPPPSLVKEGPQTFDGFDLKQADGLELLAEGNEVHFTQEEGDPVDSTVAGALEEPPELVGFHLDGFDAGNLTFARNRVEPGTYGVEAHQFSKTVHWWLRSNDFRTEKAWRATETENPPEEESEP